MTLLEKCGVWIFFVKRQQCMGISLKGREGLLLLPQLGARLLLKGSTAPCVFCPPTREFSLGDLTQGNLALV